MDFIKPWNKNQRYWQYKRQPVLLLGGSVTDHLFLLDNLSSHLDEIQSAGGNYVRNTMSQREGKILKPHKLLPDGQFNLSIWNEEYWIRFQNMLDLTSERDIIVQIEIWDRFDYSMEFWQHSPWNPANNVNYTSEDTGLDLEYSEHPIYDKQPFFHTVPGMERYEERFDTIREHQNRFVLKMLSYSLQYGHVLYCMNNETSTPHAWGEYWIEFVHREADKRNAEIYTTDMPGDAHKPEQSINFRYVLDHPRIYPFIDISQVNINFGQAHWEKLQWILNEIKSNPRPMNNTKIYSDSYYSFGTGGPKDGVERFFRDILAGCASVRFHRPDAGIGLNYIAKAAIAAARKMESLVRLWDIDAAMELLMACEYNQAYVAARPGEKCIVYFTYGGRVNLDLSNFTGAFNIKWIDVSSGEWGGRDEIDGGKTIDLSAPDAGGWIAVIVPAVSSGQYEI